MQNPIVTFETTKGVIKAELYPEIAPNTVNNFISLVSRGFYDGTIFHRVIPGFMIQGGDPEGTGMGGPGYGIHGEFAANGFENNLKHTTGVLSMARSQRPNSAGSQFFIMVDNAPYLDGQYAAFGKVIEGIDVAQAIVSLSPRPRRQASRGSDHGKGDCGNLRRRIRRTRHRSGTRLNLRLCNCSWGLRSVL